MYGYMRLHDGEADQAIRDREKAMKRFAEAEGYHLVTIFYEDEPGRFPAFTELLDELQRAEAYDVVVPTLNDLSGHRLIRSFMLEKLEDLAGAAVHVMGAKHEKSTARPGRLGDTSTADAIDHDEDAVETVFRQH
ncbi:hypothetical protein Mth01_10880 [Sphaerimonospora thailandensis]|uniref:Resolvase/invertase-type recombinase catalytic domain-containing protein n=2 Tax=Sphaerimonospora thailandensis TaxID=795644 RepID=A0A8J3R6Q0_9ACTN|nr:hypothetical protein Mth01_10880 [Sphaerimonospora thailandensis]